MLNDTKGDAPEKRQRFFAAHIFAPINLTWSQFIDLTIPFFHSSQSRRHRYALIISRVQLVSLLFAFLVPAWSVIDYIFLNEHWQQLALYRLVAGGIFLALAMPRNLMNTLPVAAVLLTAMLMIPPVFYIATIPILAEVPAEGVPGLFRTVYAFLPYTVVAGLSIFPLTILEVLLLALPVFGVTLYGGLQLQGGGLEDQISTLWLLVLIMGTSMFSGLSQLQYMIALVNRATHDALTGAFTRRTGNETLDLQFRVACMHNKPIAIAFFDIDNFKSINDTFGHDVGDQALKGMAESLRNGLRRGDALIRWGGEEFLLLLVDADAAGAKLVVERLQAKGFGMRPDGKPLTVSIGVVERIADQIEDWPKMVELADHRMYEAKQSGKDRAVLPHDEVLLSKTS